MDILHKDRSQLKSYFLTDAVPTQDQFGELIDGMLNQRDDGVAKQAGHPLCIEAAGDRESAKATLQLYDSFADDDPAWTVGLNPRIDADDPATARRGLSVHGADGASRLFIDQASGRVGIGTLEPRAALHVAGTIIADGYGGPSMEWRPIPTFHSGWRAAEGGYAGDSIQPPGYYKDASGIVHFRGRLHGGRTASYTVILEMEEGYRPEGILYFPVATGSTLGSVMVMPQGQIRVTNGAHSNALHLDTIQYRAHH